MTFRKPSTSRGRRGAVVLAGLVLAAGLAACSSSSTPSASSAGNAAPAEPAAAQDKAQAQENLKQNAGGAAVAPQGAPNQGKPAQLPAVQRSIVYTGSMRVRVDDVNAAAGRLVGMAAGAGGFIGGDQRQIDSGKSTATLILRIPADKFASTLDEISRVGKEQSRQVSTQDVTANVVDLAARIQAQQASVDRVRALLAKAQTIAEITSVEGELSRREADLESLKGQQRSLDDLTALSTISVTLLGPDAAAPAAAKKAETGFLAGLKAGWKAFAASVRVVLTVLGAVLPFVVVLGVPLWLVFWWLRRRTRAAALRSATATAAATPKAGTEG
ncbi:MAG: hypothetical protein AUI14_25025 [Actinobacteria bacterium 13_2_20CM_2_71_6]|nr:MAG: hypothetical protein AUI14_25025 [Actinobacteria bacterium 13_2_20CM_2_71_6]